jgi:hypothetical protein
MIVAGALCDVRKVTDMSDFIELSMADGANIFVEIKDSIDLDHHKPAHGAHGAGTFEGALHNIQRISNGLYHALSKLTHAPDSAMVEFGVKLTGGAGVIITSGMDEANIKITLNWQTAPAHA